MIRERFEVEVRGFRIPVEVEDLTEVQVRAVAAELSERLDAAEKQTGIVDTSKLAILAALNLLAERARLQMGLDNDRAADSGLIAKAKAALETALASCPPPPGQAKA